MEAENNEIEIEENENNEQHGGLKSNLHGDLYQWSLLSWVALKAIEKNRQFVMYTEDERFEKFDDVVLEYENEVIFLQAKHISTGKEFRKIDFFRNSERYIKRRACLAKYFDSWYRLKKQYENKQCHFIFITNIGISKDFETYLINYNIDNINDNISELDFSSGIIEDFNGQTRKININNDIKYYIRSYTEIENKDYLNLDELIENFLNDFIIKYKQPNLEEMLKIISKTNGENYPSIAVPEFIDKIQQKILNWFADRRKTKLTSSEFKTIFESAKGDALRFYLIADNQKFENALNGTSIPEIVEFLKPDNTASTIRIKKSPGIELRIAQSIKENKFNKDQYAYSTCDCSSQYLLEIIKGEQLKILVIDFSKGKQVYINSELLEKAKNEAKKIILIVKNGQQLNEHGEFIVDNNSCCCCCC